MKGKEKMDERLNQMFGKMNQHEIISFSSISLSGVSIVIVVVMVIAAILCRKKYKIGNNSECAEEHEKRIHDLEVKMTNKMVESDRILLVKIIKGLEEVNNKITR